MIESIQLTEHINALLCEMYYLKENGTAKYKINNGQLVKKSALSFWYSFELETEVPIYEDSPISITVGDNEEKGSVYNCDNLQIIIITSVNLGQSVPTAYISTDPWILIEKLIDKLKTVSERDRIACKLIRGRNVPSTAKDYHDIPTGQDKAKDMATHNEITLIWGPPGTGKTHTISEIALSSVLADKTVLIVSNSNVSVDNIIYKISERIDGDTKFQGFLQNGVALRYGYVRIDELTDKYPDAVSSLYTLRKHPELIEQRKMLLKRKKELKNNYAPSSKQELAEIASKLKEIKNQISNEEKNNVSKAKIVATTISKIYMDTLFDFRRFDYVIVDEVSMAYTSQVFCMAMYASEHLICVGDFCQLAPIAVSNAKKTLQIDVFSYLGINSSSGNLFYHPWLVLLDVQRRMHPKVSSFSRRQIYRNLIKDYDDRNFIISREKIIDLPPLSNEALSLINIAGMNCPSSKNDNNSRYNILSAIIAFATAFSLKEKSSCSIGIITPYNAQAKLIRALINDLNKSDLNLSCSTVHQFQGSEKDVIVLDAVESYPSSKIGLLLSSNENTAVSRLINVAVTRAKAKFVLLANKHFWEKHSDNSNKMKCLITHIEENGNVVSTSGRDQQSLSSYINDLSYGGNIDLFSDFRSCRTKILNDISSAKKKIIVLIPDSKFTDNSELFILDGLQKAMVNDVQVKIKAKDNADLPFSWKKNCIISDNALFPIIIIDDEVLWYGLPVSKGRLNDGKSGTETVCNAIFRIIGKKTLKTIKELVDPESTYTTKSDETSLQQQFEQNQSLSSYIYNNTECDECSCGMTMVKGKTGKPYLTCKKCRTTQLISPSLIDDYIDDHSPKCPYCHSANLRSGLSRYGIYIQCNSCRKFIKLFEI